MPAAAIPKEGSAIEPAIIVRTADRHAIQHDRAIVNGIAAIAFIVTGIGVAWSRRIISWPIVISGDAYADAHARGAYADMDAWQADADMHLRVRGV
jgi:hypothetical protein